jgi:4-amino-4-deoxy-L-arabinose transferase-like glycosyltransferase
MSTSLHRPPVASPGVPSPRIPVRGRQTDRRAFAARGLRGRDDDAAWVRPCLLGLLVATAMLYLWGLGASGWANSYYSAAAQAGSVSWKAFFYGASDAASSITVDKTPASLWVMALSVRLFGLNSWSILVPQALMGVAAVGVLYAAVRRWFPPAAGLLAGAALALTPVATLMFRFNNPDALLTLLLVLGAYAIIRAVERAGTGWLLLAAACVGVGFLTKMLQALLVVPAFAGVYLLAAPATLRRRIGQLAMAGLTLIASAGWWVAIVELVPASMRPYIGGSQTNSLLELTLGYNGLGRLNGNETGSVGGAPGGSGWGETGWTRMFAAEVGGQIAWLLPAALLLLAAGLWLTRRAPRTDRARAAFALWGGWLVVTGLVFSFMQGIFHAYYAVALAPAVAALVGIGATTLWRLRHRPPAAATLAATCALTALWSWVLLARGPDVQPWLGGVVLVAGLAAGAGLLAVTRLLLPRRAALAVAGVGLFAALAGPAAYALDTAATPHAGAIPSAGPTVAGARGPGGGPGQAPDGRFPGAPGDGFRGGAAGAGRRFAPGPAGGDGRGMGGLLNGSRPSADVVAVLEQDASSYTWVAATVGANNAAGYQLATASPVMPIGGFNGSDPAPTLAQFQQYVQEGRIHYFIGSGGGMRSDSGSNASQEIAAWVADTFTPTTVGGVTVYDLTTTMAAN